MRIQQLRWKQKRRDPESVAEVNVESIPNEVAEPICRPEGQNEACAIYAQFTTQTKAHITEGGIILWDEAHFGLLREAGYRERQRSRWKKDTNASCLIEHQVLLLMMFTAALTSLLDSYMLIRVRFSGLELCAYAVNRRYMKVRRFPSY